MSSLFTPHPGLMQLLKCSGSSSARPGLVEIWPPSLLRCAASLPFGVDRILHIGSPEPTSLSTAVKMIADGDTAAVYMLVASCLLSNSASSGSECKSNSTLTCVFRQDTS